MNLPIKILILTNESFEQPQNRKNDMMLPMNIIESYHLRFKNLHEKMNHDSLNCETK